ncbi:unnamed protein product [Acanthoscelides obtectus]|uniref:Uncharacterized protein n=1 Tax=Acanthoscelides obtectus TaxID=200917 RepID=A0A9P0L5Z2_ACAOB|nr:unnamed protein product [Acanthoscelides obtectus]CAK1624562.1 hypothetical protein AOBTE_LOCUS2613 [Acanthoscelides obtectus]
MKKPYTDSGTKDVRHCCESKQIVFIVGLGLLHTNVRSADRLFHRPARKSEDVILPTFEYNLTHLPVAASLPTGRRSY